MWKILKYRDFKVGDIVHFNDDAFELEGTLAKAYRVFSVEPVHTWRGEVLSVNGSFLRVDLGYNVKPLINIDKGQVILLCGH